MPDFADRPIRLGTTKQWAIMDSATGKLISWAWEKPQDVTYIPMVFNTEQEAIDLLPASRRIFGDKMVVVEVITRIGMSKQTIQEFMGKCDGAPFTIDEVAQEAEKVSDARELSEAAREYREAKLRLMKILTVMDFQFG